MTINELKKDLNSNFNIKLDISAENYREQKEKYIKNIKEYLKNRGYKVLNYYDTLHVRCIINNEIITGRELNCFEFNFKKAKKVYILVIDYITNIPRIEY